MAKYGSQDALPFFVFNIHEMIARILKYARR